MYRHDPPDKTAGTLQIINAGQRRCKKSCPSSLFDPSHQNKSNLSGCSNGSMVRVSSTRSLLKAIATRFILFFTSATRVLSSAKNVPEASRESSRLVFQVTRATRLLHINVGVLSRRKVTPKSFHHLLAIFKKRQSRPPAPVEATQHSPPKNAGTYPTRRSQPAPSAR